MEEPDLVISRLAMPITLPRSPALTTMAPLSLVSVFASDEPLSITRLTPLISASAEATDSQLPVRQNVRETDYITTP